MARADFGTNGFGSFFDEGGAAPFRFGLADAKEKFSKDFRAAIGVFHLGVKFNSVNFALRVFDSGDSVFRTPGGAKARRKRHDMVAVAIPDAQRVWHTRKKLGFGLAGAILDVQQRTTVFAAFCLFHFSAQRISEPLHAVADTKDREAKR